MLCAAAATRLWILRCRRRCRRCRHCRCVIFLSVAAAAAAAAAVAVVSPCLRALVCVHNRFCDETIDKVTNLKLASKTLDLDR